jgi:hypothetical protein
LIAVPVVTQMAVRDTGSGTGAALGDVKSVAGYSFGGVAAVVYPVTAAEEFPSHWPLS